MLANAVPTHELTLSATVVPLLAATSFWQWLQTRVQ